MGTEPTGWTPASAHAVVLVPTREKTAATAARSFRMATERTGPSRPLADYAAGRCPHSGLRCNPHRRRALYRPTPTVVDLGGVQSTHVEPRRNLRPVGNPTARRLLRDRARH